MNISTPELPPLSDETIDRMESAVFDRIGAERAAVRPSGDAHDATRAARSRSRRHGWLTASGIAAAFVVGVMVAPPLINSTSGLAGGATSESAVAPLSSPQESGLKMLDMSTEQMAGSAADMASDREMITSATATVRVDDIKTAADEIAALAKRQGGFVESVNIGSTGVVTDQSMPAPEPRSDDYGWISIRVPSAELAATIAELEKTGEVIASSTNATDVTATAIDLRARIDATRASVQRLTELMAQTGTVGELIEAEVALTDRQAQLESYEQQLADLENQVAMSSLQVELTRTATVTEPDPAGFGDGLLAGWNGLLISLNALVIAFGFLLPWLGVAAVIALIVWAIARARRARRTHAATAEPAASAE